MKYFFFLCLLFSCIFAKCDQYTTKETCIDNCWCLWRGGSWKYPDACIQPGDPAQSCGYGTGGNCWDNEGTACYVADFLILLFEIGLFLLGIGGSVILAVGTLVVIILLITGLFNIISEEMKRRNLEHWLTYGEIAISYAVTAVGIIFCVGILFVVLRAVFHVISMLYESNF